jgi:hypothetical protein
MFPVTKLFLSFNEINSLKVFENGVERRMFGTNRKGIKGSGEIYKR